MRYRAAAALPSSDTAGATAGLRGRLRIMAQADGARPDWSTLEVEGPVEVPRPTRPGLVRVDGHRGGGRTSQFAVNADRCPAHVAVAPGRLVRCTGPVGHGPAEDMHQGLLRVTLSDGREHAASLVWSTAPSPWDDDILARGMR